MSTNNVQVNLLILVAALALTLFLVSSKAGSIVRAAPQQTIVRCEPEIIISDFKTPVSFTIFVENVAELNAADVRMSFDPSVAQIADAEANVPGTQIELLDEFLSPDFVVRKVADNEAGTIWYANTQVNPTAPVSGSGPLARVTLQPQTVGAFFLEFTYQELVMNNGAQIPAIARDCEVSFFDPDNLRSTYLPLVRAE